MIACATKIRLLISRLSLVVSTARELFSLNTLSLKKTPINQVVYKNMKIIVYGLTFYPKYNFSNYLNLYYLNYSLFLLSTHTWKNMELCNI
jgi:hypothetical protein